MIEQCLIISRVRHYSCVVVNVLLFHLTINKLVHFVYSKISLCSYIIHPFKYMISLFLFMIYFLIVDVHFFNKFFIHSQIFLHLFFNSNILFQTVFLQQNSQRKTYSKMVQVNLSQNYGNSYDDCFCYSNSKVLVCLYPIFKVQNYAI